MAQSAQSHVLELVALVTGVARVGSANARILQRAAKALECASRSVPASNPAAVIPQLQQAFQTLSQCVLLIREETDRLNTIVQTDFSPPD